MTIEIQHVKPDMVTSLGQLTFFYLVLGIEYLIISNEIKSDDMDKFIDIMNEVDNINTDVSSTPLQNHK